MNFGTTQNIVLDLYQNRYVSVEVSQNDIESREVIVTITNKGKFYQIPEGVSVRIKYLKSDGKKVLNDCEILSNGTVRVELTDQMALATGRNNADLLLIESETEKVLYSPSFIVNVRPGVFSNDDIESSNEFLALENALIKVDGTDERLQELITETQEVNERATAIAEGIDEAVIEARELEEATLLNSTNARNSEISAKTYMEGAKASETIATQKAQESLDSSVASKTSEELAKSSELAAKQSEENAKDSENQALISENVAIEKANEASVSATSALSSENKAKASEDASAINANNAEVSATSAQTYAAKSENYAIGETDSAKYYYEQSVRISQSLNGLIPMGTITFEELSLETNQKSKYMFNISNDFTTDNTFKEGVGKSYGAGTNVYRTEDGYWDALAGSTVTGVKGENETIYRQGNINITLEDMGIPKVENTSDMEKPVSTAQQAALDLKANLEDLGSLALKDKVNEIDLADDVLQKIENAAQGNPPFVEAEVRENIVSGESTSEMFGKISKYFTDLQDIAFSGSYNDLTDVPEGGSGHSYVTGSVLHIENVSAEASYIDGDTLVVENMSAIDIVDGLDSTDPTSVLSGNQGRVLKEQIDTVDFYSGDAENPSTWTNVNVLNSGESRVSLFGKISTMIKNIRYLYKMLGTTDISKIDNGTITGAISSLNSSNSVNANNISTNATNIASLNQSLSQTTDVTITSATNVKIDTYISCVKNGIYYYSINVMFTGTVSLNAGLIASGFPIPYNEHVINKPRDNDVSKIAQFIFNNGNLKTIWSESNFVNGESVCLNGCYPIRQ